MESNKMYNGYVEEKDDTFYPTCRFCGKQTLPDAPYLSQAEADEAATIRCDCFEAREYQEKLRKEKERADNIIKLRQRLDDFTEYSASRGVDLSGDLHDLLLSVGTSIIDGKIAKAVINVGRIKVNLSSGAKSIITICFTYSDGAKLEV
nr:MAG TPA: 50S ribosomal subunit [Caudoviricetes sp.]